MKKSKLLSLIFDALASSQDLADIANSVSGFACAVIDVYVIAMDRPRFLDLEMREEFAPIVKLFGLSKIADHEEASRVRDAVKEYAAKKSALSASLVIKKVNSFAEQYAAKNGTDVVDTIGYAEAIKQAAPELISLLQNAVIGAKGGDYAVNFESGKANENEKEEPAEKETAKPEPPRKKVNASLGTLTEDVKAVQRLLLDDIYGQDVAINRLVAGYFQSELMPSGKNESTAPKATFLFAGPPGVGKTFLAEMAAKHIGLPYKRFDMSEYSDDEATYLFNGSNDVFKGSKPGIVTSFVEENPHCILLFDEIEKAHLKVIYLFLQILDRGILADANTKREVSFRDAIIIFTTNVGKRLYEDKDYLASIPSKTILKAIGNERNPATGEALFPAAIVSRFASGNVLMFNHLTANDLLKIINVELAREIAPFKKERDIDVVVDKRIAYSLLFAEGANADARTVKGRARAFFFSEIYELYRLMTSENNDIDADKVKRIKFEVQLPKDPRVTTLFENAEKAEILIFADSKLGKEISALLPDIKCYVTDNVEKAKDIMLLKPITLILIDIDTKKENGKKVLNREDVASAGRDFFDVAVERTSAPIYIVERTPRAISFEETQSFCTKGARGVLTIAENLTETIGEQIEYVYQQAKLRDLARANKVLSFNTSQSVSDDGTEATITLFDYRLRTAVDADDSENMVGNLERPDVTFDDVIGAEDAKDELKYFVEYMKNPRKYAAKGLRAPKGILLYGPPGTGKTLLAKAMAGESEATYISMQGNQFKKKYIGEGPELVHTVFAKARKYAPTVLFLDEIDAIGLDRDGGGDAESAANTDVLTALLAEMDGFDAQSADKPVFVLAATNKEKNLDEALNRRFDRRILIGLPTRDEREAFIRLKMRKNPKLAIDDATIVNVADRSIGMSLSDLDTIVEIAMRLSVRKNSAIDEKLLDEALETFVGGKQLEKSQESYKRTAVHETGHALVQCLNGQIPSYITIVARGDYGGYVMRSVDEKKGVYLKQELLDRICSALAGRAAEVVKYGDEDGISTGPSADLRQATDIAMDMVTVYGMDDGVGLTSIRASEAGSKYHETVLARVHEILSEQFERAKKLISDNIDAFDKFVAELLEKTSLKENEIKELYERCKK